MPQKNDLVADEVMSVFLMDRHVDWCAVGAIGVNKVKAGSIVLFRHSF